MVETPEGIGGRKWSFQKEANGDLALFEGSNKKLAVLTPSGKEVFNLFVTSPQLWDAANEFLKDGSAENILRLQNMVAKSVGKTDWRTVAQAE